MPDNAPVIVAIVGPTGVGKTGLAVRLAGDLNGEIVNADSRQVYRHMDIGTAKPTPEERSKVPHHLIDVISPDEDFGLKQYQVLACGAIDAIQRRRKLPMLVGGTGQYVRAVVEGWQVPAVAPDLEYRKRLEDQAASGRSAELYEELTHLDPDAATGIDPRNVRRVIRALEVTHSAGKPFSALRKKAPPAFETLMIGLTMERSQLYRRVDGRVDDMIRRGLVEEVQRLVEMGYGFDLPAMSGIGYRQMREYIENRATLADAIQQIKHETHRFIRHQYNWFRPGDERIAWFDGLSHETLEKVAARIGRFAGRRHSPGTAG